MKKYYNWERIIGNNVRVYDELFEEYYGTSLQSRLTNVNGNPIFPNFGK